MSAARRLLTATLSYGLSSYVPRLVNFILLPVYARFLDPTQMGIIEVLTALDTLLAAVTRLGLPGALSRSYFDNRDPDHFRDLITTIAFALALGCGALTLVAAAVGPLVFARFLPEVPYHPYVEIVLVTSFLRAAPELQSRILQAQEQAVLAAKLNVSMSLFGSLTRVVLIVGMEWSVLGALLAELATAALGLLIAALRHRDDLRGRFRPDLLRPALSYGLPLVPHHLGGWLAEFGGRWVMGGLGVLAAVGELAVAARLVSPVQVAAGAFATAFGPVYFGWRKDLAVEEAVEKVRQTSAVVLGVAAALALGGATAGTVLLRWALPPAYRAAADATGLLATGMLVRVMYNLLGTELLYAKRTLHISIVFLTGSVVTIGLTILLVPLSGSLGAALAQASGTTVSVAITALLARQTFPLGIAPRALMAVLMAGAIAAVAPFLMAGRAWWSDALSGGVIFAVGALAALALAGAGPRAIRGFLEQRKKSRKKKPPAG